MALFYLHDLRVIGETPRCDFAVRVNASDHLGPAIQELADQIDHQYQSNGWFNELHILCHGTPQGLLLGTPILTQLNLGSAFTPLRGKVGNIIVHGCGAAAVYNRGTPPAGPYNGELFCRLLAISAGASVSASSAAQTYIPSASMVNTSGRNQLSAWRGIVGTWNSHGQLIGQSSPSQR
ncbi:MAG TPA: hypothetical protein VGQ55_13120 [Pyrinomonadaceae bacterium]|jgi:hypothetical protein|nr:hypothetical protein [Pyrinomonadaceae bacterium]